MQQNFYPSPAMFGDFWNLAEAFAIPQVQSTHATAPHRAYPSSIIAQNPHLSDMRTKNHAVLSEAYVNSSRFAGKRLPRDPEGYICGHWECKKRFDTRAQMNKHRRSHIPADQREHKCSNCSKRFNDACDLKRHRKPGTKCQALGKSGESPGDTFAPTSEQSGSHSVKMTNLHQDLDRNDAVHPPKVNLDDIFEGFVSEDRGLPSRFADIQLDQTPMGQDRMIIRHWTAGHTFYAPNYNLVRVAKPASGWGTVAFLPLIQAVHQWFSPQAHLHGSEANVAEIIIAIQKRCDAVQSLEQSLSFSIS